MNNSAENLGRKIKILREHFGFTQSAISSYLKVDQSVISMAEKGEYALTSDMIEKLNDLFGVPIITCPEEELCKRLFTFCGCEINEEELEVIATINRIALNSSFMAKLLESNYISGAN